MLHSGAPTPGATVSDVPAPISSRPMLAPPATKAYYPYVIFERALTEAQCDRVLDSGLSASAGSAELQRAADSEADDAIRSSRVDWIAPGPEHDWLYKRLGAVAAKANRSYGFDLTGFAEDVQFTAYDTPGAFYTWHVDGLDTGVAQRKLSIVVQLSDPADYRGATLEFLPTATDLDEDAHGDHVESISGRGTAIVFPSFEYHRVTPLISGVRYSLVSWVSGPPFR